MYVVQSVPEKGCSVPEPRGRKRTFFAGTFEQRTFFAKVPTGRYGMSASRIGFGPETVPAKMYVVQVSPKSPCKKCTLAAFSEGPFGSFGPFAIHQIPQTISL